MIKYEIIDEWVELKEPLPEYRDLDSLNEITYEIIGACFDVYNELGRGFLEAVYKDALEIELKSRGIQYEREKKYEIEYKGVALSHFYIADFVAEDRVIFEVKAQSGIIEQSVKQVLNYLAVSSCEVAILVNFGEQSLKYKRVVLSK